MKFAATVALLILVAFTAQLASAQPWTLSFSTYFGGNDMTSATAVAVDGSGNVYVAGWTDSTDLPGCTPVRPQAGGVDAFVAKWDGATHLIDYCTFLGGRGDDRAFAIAVDGTGNAYVTGRTMSTNFPVFEPMQGVLVGAVNAFVAKLSPAGVLIYSSYLGGNGSDSGNAIAVDNSGRVTVVGNTTSANFPLMNPIQITLQGQTNVFVARLSPAGDSLVYSTYLGGSGNDYGAAVALDGTGAAYLTGSTTSRNFPTVNAFQPTSGGNQDVFVAKIASTGTSLVYSTYLGGSGGTVGLPETGSGIAVDGAGDAYVTGTTSSPNFPLANPLYSISAGVGTHAFVSELNPNGNGLVYSTYLGGSSIDQAAAIAVDSSGNAVVVGFTASPDFPLVDPTQASLAGAYDAFVTRLAPAGTALLQSTLFGGSASDSANAVVCDAADRVYVAGQTQSLNFPIQDATQAAPAGIESAFFAVFALPLLQPVISSIAPNPVPLNQATVLTVNGSNFGSGFTASVSIGGTTYPLSPAALTFVSSAQVQIWVEMGGVSAYTAMLNITNPGGFATSQTFPVVIPPAITSITPNPVPLNQAAVLAVSGSGFQSGFTASVSIGGTTYPFSPAALTFVSSSQVRIWVEMGGTSAYTATLNVTNPGGLTASQTFPVGTPPAISSIVPNPVPLNQATVLTVNGCNFQSGFTASVSVGGTTYPLSPAALTFVSSSQVQIWVEMGGTSAYTATLNIANPGGLTVSGIFPVALQPVIGWITPDPVPLNQITVLAINGSNFQSALTASVSIGSTTYPLSPAALTFVSSSQVQIWVEMGGTSAYIATLNITNPGGLTASQAFPVGTPPAISSIVPNPVPLNQATVLTVNGCNFQSGLTASVSIGSTTYPLSPVALGFISSSQVQIWVEMGGTSAYTATLNITNPSGLTASQTFSAGTN